MNEFLKIIFGNYTFIQLLGYSWFFLIGYIIFGLSEVTSRDPSSPNTPVKFSFKFWFLDNWKRYLVTILCTYVLFRFYNEISGHELQNFDCIQLGLTGDFSAAALKNKIKSFADDRQKLMLKLKEKENNNIVNKK